MPVNPVEMDTRPLFLHPTDSVCAVLLGVEVVGKEKAARRFQTGSVPTVIHFRGLSE